MANNTEKERAALPKDKFLTTQEIADIFRVSLRTVGRWLEAGYFHPVKVGHFNLIPRFEVEEILNGGGQPYIYHFDESGELRAYNRAGGEPMEGF